MRRFNVGKMRRHIARNVADEIKVVMDPMQDDYQQRVEDLVEKFEQRMKIKHKNQGRVIGMVQANYDKWPCVTVIARHVKEDR